MNKFSPFDEKFFESVGYFGASDFAKTLHLHAVSKALLRKHLDARSGLTKASDEKHLVFIYDLRSEPISFDFLIRLAQAEVYRRQCKAASFEVLVITREGRDEYGKGWESANGANDTFIRIHEIIASCIRLFPSVTNTLFLDGRHAAAYVLGHELTYPEKPLVLSSLVQGRTLPPTPFTLNQITSDEVFPLIIVNEHYLKIIDQYLKRFSKPIITITIREHAYLSQARNSRTEDWVNFARIARSEYDVIFVPDSSNFESSIDTYSSEFVVFKEVCWNISLRAALYRRAMVNIGVDGGPLFISMFQEGARTIMFADYGSYPADYRAYIEAQYFGGKRGADRTNSVLPSISSAKFCFGALSVDYILSEFNLFIASL